MGVVHSTRQVRFLSNVAAGTARRGAAWQERKPAGNIRSGYPPNVYSRELVELIFVQPYCKIEFMVDAGIANGRLHRYT